MAKPNDGKTQQVGKKQTVIQTLKKLPTELRCEKPIPTFKRGRRPKTAFRAESPVTPMYRGPDLHAAILRAIESNGWTIEQIVQSSDYGNPGVIRRYLRTGHNARSGLIRHLMAIVGLQTCSVGAVHELCDAVASIHARMKDIETLCAQTPNNKVSMLMKSSEWKGFVRRLGDIKK